MVKNTRFDPLLTLDVEQRLFADLPASRRACGHRRQGGSGGRSRRIAVRRRRSTRSCSPKRHSLSIASSRASRVPRASPAQDAALVLPAESRRWPGFLPRLLELEQDGLVIAPAGLAAVAASLQAGGSEPSRRDLRRRIARIADHSLAGDIEYVASATHVRRPRAAGHAHPLRRRFHALPGRRPRHRHRRSRQRAAHRAAARGGRRVAPSLFAAPRRRAHGAHRSQPSRHLGQRRARARTRRGAARRSRARRHAGRGVHADFRGGISRARARHEETPRIRSLHAVVPRLHLLRLRRGGAVLHHHAGAGAARRKSCASTSSRAR